MCAGCPTSGSELGSYPYAETTHDSTLFQLFLGEAHHRHSSTANLTAYVFHRYTGVGDRRARGTSVMVRSGEATRSGGGAAMQPNPHGRHRWAKWTRMYVCACPHSDSRKMQHTPGSLNTTAVVFLRLGCPHTRRASCTTREKTVEEKSVPVHQLLPPASPVHVSIFIQITRLRYPNQIPDYVEWLPGVAGLCKVSTTAGEIARVGVKQETKRRKLERPLPERAW